ncbi:MULTISPECIES: sulfur oxidation c-type cytochrome SoxX [Methylobacter]|uniref:sulfur oxidation c-type cytochrome SoxX n=1 Tax=Methylobacter TaxID=429 RepID=UPI0003612808|nr:MULTISPECIES: sulfur oxidation c-type cytochrome SoxX [Methylobacter]
MNIRLIVPSLLLLSCTGMTGIPEQRLDEGRQIAFDRNKGNCLACHVIEDGEAPGNIGPALSAIPSRFKDKRQLREQIWDATRFNPETSMPPFGRNNVLDAEEIDKVVDYLWSLE